MIFGAKQLEDVFRDQLREGSSKTIEPLEYVAKGMWKHKDTMKVC